MKKIFSVNNVIRFVFILICATFIPLSVHAQEMNAQQINQKISQIRKSTNWDDSGEAKKANDEIKRLSKQLMLLKGNINTKNPGKIDEIKQKNIEAREQVWGQMMKAFQEGKESDLLLGTPVREEIKEEYKNDESPIVKNQDILEQQTLLVIDMSQKYVQRVIDQMQNFKSIKTLVITGGKYGVPVNLSNLLSRAKDYPLQELYIINFKQFVKKIPKDIGVFTGLQLLSLVGNQIDSIPYEVKTFSSLKILYADDNPITTILPFITTLKSLEEIGVAKTKISQGELKQIAQQFNNCKVLQK